MNVLVTGSAGFLGRRLTDALEARGDTVTAIDIAEGCDALDLFRDGHRRFDLVFHCAAVAPHRSAIDGRPLTVGAGNLELDSALFQWAARTQPGRVVYFSSSAAYPVCLQDGSHRDPLREHDTLIHPEQPDAIYGAVKAMGERLARLYRDQGGAVTVVRPFSGYGEDQSADFPFGAFRIRALAREDPFTVWGDGTQVRDWVHIDDVVGAVLASVDNDVDGPVNICTGIGTSMAQLARMFAVEAGYAPRFEFLADRPSGVTYRVGDPTRLNEIYTPKVTIEEGVKRALAQQPVNM
ncbi:NAD-dependent epimerase/dehydratase family protein [Spirillospora sp. NPDC048911]|uniref:NAD-dependent epimerase/dehydratase family protein n=1 Tax=Spirillospora sp. NPDC048911 TaxID=3364527 RepID=UPI003720FC95